MDTIKEIRKKLGIRKYLIITPSIRRAEQVKPKKAFHITNDKKILQNKKFIEKKIENLKIMTPTQWQKYVYQRLKPKEQKKIKEKLEKNLQKEKR